jgi:hypothetical protein
VLSYSDDSNNKDDYFNFYSPSQDYFVMKGQDFYFVKSDEAIHYRKLSSTKIKDCHQQFLLEDNNGNQYILEAYYDESTPEDKYVFMNMVDRETGINEYSFLLDWQSRNKKVDNSTIIALLQ